MIEQEESAQLALVVDDLIALLQRLLAEGEPGHIDLQQRPLRREVYGQLVELLGDGGVTVTAGEEGLSQLRATAIPGVWWVAHLNEDGSVDGEFLEVNYVPDLIIPTDEAVKEGLDNLRAGRFQRGLRPRNHQKPERT